MVRTGRRFRAEEGPKRREVRSVALNQRRLNTIKLANDRGRPVYRLALLTASTFNRLVQHDKGPANTKQDLVLPRTIRFVRWRWTG